MRVPLKPRPYEQGNHRATAAHLSHRGDRDREISFADVLALPDPDWIGRDPNAPVERTDLMPELTASAATVSTLVMAYDDLATEVENLLKQLAELAPFTAGRKPLASGADRYTVAQLDGKACGRCRQPFRLGDGRPDFHAHVSMWNVYRHQVCPKAGA